jgi:UTP-glucose-1-phosphate uridylyltransferase
MTQPTLLVLAAGMGSRYGGLKQLDAIGPAGETIIDYSVYDAKRAGFGNVVFVIRRDIEDVFKDKVGCRYAGEIPVTYAYQQLDALPAGFSVPEGREKPWGTGHAILAARDLINEPFAVINADDFYGAGGYTTACKHLQRAQDSGNADYCLIGYRLGNTLSEHGSVSRGICQRDTDGYLDHVVETHNIARADGGIHADGPDGGKQRLSGDEVVSMNLWGFTPSIFDHLESQFKRFLKTRGGEMKSEFYIPSVVNELIQSGQARAKVLSCEAKWFGVTFREDRPSVEESVRKLVEGGVYPSPLWKG